VFAQGNDVTFVKNEADKVGMSGEPYVWLFTPSIGTAQSPQGSFAGFPYVNTSTPQYLDFESRMHATYPCKL
jgi:hypothetical protein